MKLRHVSTAFLVTCLLLVCSQGQGAVTVTGDIDPTGATDPWEVVSLYVGKQGAGTLNISDGTVVSNTDGYIGYYLGSMGTVTVTGEGSELNNSEDLRVGYLDGEGTLNIMDGGVVNVAGTTTLAIQHSASNSQTQQVDHLYLLTG